MDKRIQRAKRNALSALLLQIVSTVVGVIIPWIMIRSFGSEAYGATTSIAQFLAYIALFEGGIGRVARGALYAPLVSKNEEEISSVYFAIKRFFTILGVAFLGYTIILATFYHRIAEVSIFSRGYAFALVIVIAIGKFAEYMGGISNITLFNADQRQYVVNCVSILSNVLNVLAIIILVKFGADILWVKLASSLVFVLKPVIFTLYLKKNYSIKKTKNRAVLKNKATGIAQHAAYVIQNNSDVLMLTVLSDLKTVAVYSVYHLVSFNLRNITVAFTSGMEAVFGNMIAKNETKELKEIYSKYKLLLTVITCTLFSAAGVLIVPFVKLYTYETTDVNYIRPIFAVIILLSEAINCITLPCFNLSIAANKLKESQVGAYTEAAIKLVASLALVFWDPLVGVALGSLISMIFRSVYYIVFSAKNILHVSVVRLFGKFFITACFLFSSIVAGSFIATNLALYNYWRWAVGGVYTVVVTACISLVFSGAIYFEATKGYFLAIKRKISGIYKTE